MRTAPFALAAALLLGLVACSGGGIGPADFPGPWGANIVLPAELVKELGAVDKPTVVCTAPAVLYRTGHVPGAVHQGPASSPQAIEELEAWAKPLPRSTNLVIYCGCCPISHCPNLKPAFAALTAMGFTRVRVLALPENFATDWVDHGYPVER